MAGELSITGAGVEINGNVVGKRDEINGNVVGEREEINGNVVSGQKHKGNGDVSGSDCNGNRRPQVPRYPPGYRFAPTEQELLINYLYPKSHEPRLRFRYIHDDIDVYDFHPQQLEEIWREKFTRREAEMLFFSPRTKKYPRGKRPRRSMNKPEVGFWRPTGTDSNVSDNNGIKIGARKCLDFYEGKYKNSQKTNWKMHEFTLAPQFLPPEVLEPAKNGDCSMKLDNVVLYKLYKKGECRKDIPVDEEDEDEEEDDEDYSNYQFSVAKNPSDPSVHNNNGGPSCVNNGTPDSATTATSSSSSSAPNSVPSLQPITNRVALPINQLNSSAFASTSWTPSTLPSEQPIPNRGSLPLNPSNHGASTHAHVLGSSVYDFLSNDVWNWNSLVLDQSTSGTSSSHALELMQPQIIQPSYNPANGGASIAQMPNLTQPQIQPGYNPENGSPSTIDMPIDFTQSHLQSASYNIWNSGASEIQNLNGGALTPFIPPTYNTLPATVQTGGGAFVSDSLLRLTEYLQINQSSQLLNTYDESWLNELMKIQSTDNEQLQLNYFEPYSFQSLLQGSSPP